MVSLFSRDQTPIATSYRDRSHSLGEVCANFWAAHLSAKTARPHTRSAVTHGQNKHCGLSDTLSAHRDPGRHPLRITPVPGLMQTCRPVVCRRKVDWSRMPAELPDAGLDELDRMRVVRGEGAFED